MKEAIITITVGDKGVDVKFNDGALEVSEGKLEKALFRIHGKRREVIARKQNEVRLRALAKEKAQAKVDAAKKAAEDEKALAAATAKEAARYKDSVGKIPEATKTT